MAVSTAFLLLRVLYLQHWTPYGLAPDEAQYWHWLSHLQLAYVTKPALTTWAMGVSTWLLGDGMAGIKAFALLGQVAVPLLGFVLASRAGGQAAGWLAFGALSTMPLIATGGLMMVPDALLLPLWLGALVLVQGEAARQRMRWRAWLGIGLLVGLGGLAKYSAALFFPLLGMFALLYRRDWLRRPHLWAAGLLALAMQAPTLYWNATHGWEGMLHVIWQADGGGDARHGGVATLLEFVGGQAGVLGLLGLGMVCLALWRGSRGRMEYTLLWWMSVPVILGFMVMTTGAKVQANWPVLGTVGAVAAGAALYPWRGWWRWLACAGLLLAGLLSLALHNTPALHELGWLKIKTDPAKELLGYRELGYIAGLKLDTLRAPRAVLATRYQTAAALAYHIAPEKTRDGLVYPQVLYVNPGDKRMTEYDLWNWPDLKDTLVLYVNEQPVLQEAVARRFDNCHPYGSTVIENHGQIYRRGWFWVCWGDRFAAE